MSETPPNVENPGYVQPGTGQDHVEPDAAVEPRYPILRYFTSDHLPEHLRTISKPFEDQAYWLVANLPPGPEVSAGLRKLLEAKDCFVRAALDNLEE